ncbi:MAG: 3-deoxy-D-manno-octulosonic acid kinase [Steroidobacteraceae bacterium]
MTRVWPVGREVVRQPIPGGALLFDSQRIPNAGADWLDPQWWQQRGTLDTPEGGRGSAWFIDADGRQMVLRHYRRGGLIARISQDRYLWWGEAFTRSFHEWNLLYQLRQAGLPVPVPLAARYLRSGRTYSAALLIERIPATRSLAALLASNPQPHALWVSVGRCLARFHRGGVYHADLNAHNVLCGAAGAVSLIDFDRGALRRPGLWRDANLVRLRRSLEKLALGWPADRFGDTDWLALLAGYFAGDDAAQDRPPQD